MYARLWWKEMRVIWPIWVALGVIAAGVQWFLLWSKVPEARSGLLIVLGLSWSTLYACAVGAGIFGGERESNTQVFLDTLPVGRRMLWKGKVSFALATTLALALALTVLGMLGTAERNPHEYPLERLVQCFGLLLLEGVAWSLLWSLALGSSLQAALAGVVTVGSLSLLLFHQHGLYSHGLLGPILAPVTIPRLALAGAALGYTWLVFTHAPLPDEPEPVRRIPARPERQFGRLIWETVRESRRIWMLLAMAWIGFLLVVRSRLLYWRGGDANLWMVFGILTNGTAAGVSVFGPANRAQTYRFFAYHGVHPGRIWTAKLVVWGVVMAGMLSVFAVLTGMTWGWLPRGAPDPLRATFVIFEAFVVGVLAGQVVRRSITAWVVAILAFILLVLPQFALYAHTLIPLASLALFPALVLTISRAWTGDWMNDLRGVPRWLRLGGMMGAAMALLVALYIGYRAWSVPGIGDPFPPRLASAPPIALAADHDAGPDFLRLSAESRERDVGTYVQRQDNGMIQIVDPAIVVWGWDRMRGSVVTWWEAQRGLIEPLRHAAAKPAATFPHVVRRPAALDPHISAMPPLFLLLGLDNFECRSRGDLAGAWEDLRAALQITNHLCRSGNYHDTSFALSWRTQVLQWALVWAGDSGQTSALLRAALAETRTLLRPVSLGDSLNDEYTLCTRMLRGNSTMLFDSTPSESAPTWFLRALPASWWERSRALRVLRLLYARQLELARYEPWQRDPVHLDAYVDGYLESTPLVRPLAPNDALVLFNTENVLLGRAFEQVAALRIWQLEHGGHYPEALDALVPAILLRLPLDPYSGQPFQYCRSGGRKLLPLGLSGRTGAATGVKTRLQPTRPGQRLLYSVGPNRFDNAAMVDYETHARDADLIFPLPPESPPQDETRGRAEADKAGAGNGGPKRH